MRHDIGYFIFSLDTELATGYYDLDKKRSRLFSPDGMRERYAIKRILDTMDAHNVAGTWAVTGHIMHSECTHCDLCPIRDWQGRYKSYEEAFGTNHPLWYGSDVVETILAAGNQHEIAFHGYSHEVFSEVSMCEERARMEIEEWMRLGCAWNLTPRSVVFPRDVIGYLNLFASEGFTCYRSEHHQSLWMRNKYFGKYLRAIDNLLALSTPPVFSPADIDCVDGMVNLVDSEYLFGFNRKFELLLDRMNLHILRMRKVVKAIRKAARENKIVHVWAHPWEFRTEKDFAKLEYILDAVADEMRLGRMNSVGMSEIADLVIAAPTTEI